MNQKRFALVAVVGLVGVAVGPGVATAASGDAGNDSTDDDDAGNAPVDGDAAFGERVSAYAQSLIDQGYFAIGPMVSEFARQRNPGNAPDHAGPPEHVGGPE